MIRISIVCLGLIAVCLTASAQPLINPFPFSLPVNDSTASDWLPAFGTEPAGSHGFVHTTPSGHLAFADSTIVRFAGMDLNTTACFPDSLGAVATARRLHKMGINMIRFDYFDYHNYDAGSTLAPGTRSDTLSPAQMQRLDWFLYQLKLNGIYAHFVLKSRNGPRSGDGVPDKDSVYSYGQYITYFSAPLQQMQKAYLAKFLGHKNAYTGLRYADDPQIALLTITDQNSMFGAWVGDRLNTRSGVLSFNQSRLLDTLYANYLRKVYGTTAALKAAYHEGIAGTGPNFLKNPGFESFTDNWDLNVGEGAQATSVIIQGPEVAPGQGSSSLRIVVRQVNGTESRIYLEQIPVPVHAGGIYHVQFMAKTDTAAGRALRVQFLRTGAPYNNLGLDTTVTLSTSWQTYNVTFRSNGDDSNDASLRLLMGKTRGDVYLDGFIFQETGQEGLYTGESLEAYNIARAKFSAAPKLALRRLIDQSKFYDSLGRAYYRTMSDFMHVQNVRVPIAGTNHNTGSADTWVQSDYDFTSESAQWDYNGARPGSSYSDSTWVIRNYQLLATRDQVLPPLPKAAIANKPFIIEGYNHVFPNKYRSEMMLFLPAYAMLQDFDGAYFYYYNDRQTELSTRVRFLQNDFQGIMADPSVMALMPQFSAIMRNHWVSPAQRVLKIEHDSYDLLTLPITYNSRGTFDIDGSFANVSTMVNEVRVDSFTAARHHTASDYYFTAPDDQNIQSDTKQITRDITTGVMSLNTPHVQGGSGTLGKVSSLKTDNLAVSWSSGGTQATYLWSALDTFALDSSRRSLLTISTRALNTGASWQFGDSSLGKNWGAAPILMESVKLGVNFYTNADSLFIYPLDTLGMASAPRIAATRNTNSWRVSIDIGALGTPWFGVQQVFNNAPITAVEANEGGVATVGEAFPNPANGECSIPVSSPMPSEINAIVFDQLGNAALAIARHQMPIGHSNLFIDTRALANGVYECAVQIGSTRFARRIIVAR